MKRKIVHVVTDLSPDGAQRTLLRLLNGLPREEYDSRVVTLKNGGSLVEQFRQSGVEVIELGMRSGLPGPRVLQRLRRAIADFRPDVVQGWMYHGNVAASIGAAMAKSEASVFWNIRRCIYDLREDKFLTRLIIRLGAWMSSRADAIVYCVSAAAEQHESLGFDRSKRIVINNRFDLTKFHATREHRAWLRESLGISPESTIVGIMGRYHPQKDFPTFFRAAAGVAKERPDVRFLVMGRGTSAGNEEVASTLRELGIDHQFHLLGERQDAPRILSAIDLFVSSSVNEGFSNVVSEAMACGIPCVATDVGASRELLEGIGAIVPPRSPEALSRAIIDALSKSEEERTAAGGALRGRIERRYSLPAMLAAYDKLYKGVLFPAGTLESSTAVAIPEN